WDFHEFRDVLADGSGAASPGFHQVIRLSPLLWEDFRALLEREAVSLIDVYMHGDQYFLLRSCAEALIDYDEAFQLFRIHHVKLAQRMIGSDALGTGGISMAILERTIKGAFFPDLWEVRNQLTQIAKSRAKVE